MDKKLLTRQHRIAWGMLLATVGISIGGLVKVALKSNLQIISIAVIVIAVALMFNPRDIRYFCRPTKRVSYILVYSIYTICLAIFGRCSFSDSTVGILYQLVYLLEIILLWSFGGQINDAVFLRKMTWVMLFANIYALWYIIANDMSTVRILIQRTDTANTVSRATIGVLGFTGFVSSLTFRPNQKLDRAIRICTLFVSLLLVIMATRRGVYIATVLLLLLRGRNTGFFGRRLNKKALIAVLIAIGVFLLIYMNSSAFRERISKAVNSLYSGITTYIGMGQDKAVAYRRQRLEEIPTEYLFNSSILQFVLGRGYNTEWLDIPVLQAFWDLGLVGGFAFLFIHDLVPLSRVLKKPTSAGVEYAQYMVILTVVASFANGVPYGSFFDIVLLYALELRDAKKLLSPAAVSPALPADGVKGEQRAGRIGVQNSV